jgi:hypothetical protein
MWSSVRGTAPGRGDIVAQTIALTPADRVERHPARPGSSSCAIARDARLDGRAIEFVATGAIAVALAVGAWVMAQEALANPLARATAALIS